MAEVINLFPNQRFSIVIDTSKDSYIAYWAEGDTVVHRYETGSLQELKTFCSLMLDRINDIDQPLPS